MKGSTIKVFVSYSHDDDDHKAWVYKLSCDLVRNGIDVVLDQWDLSLGINLPKFMERGLAESNRVLVICTDSYIEKSDQGYGGVGYEKNILTADLLMDQDSNKFVPVVRNVARKVKTPMCLSGRLYIDFSDDECYQDVLFQLLHEMYGVPIRPKPELGKSPFLEDEYICNDLPELKENSTEFFYRRFNNAFPGVRGIEWFRKPDIATQRLKLLLEKPLQFKNEEPIWWWRSGKMGIKNFDIAGNEEALMDCHEIILDKIAAVNYGSYYQCFVYVQTKASEPSGLYDYSYVSDSIENQGFAREECGVFDGGFIRREEYDDGAAVINGLPVKLDGSESLIIKYLTPYNFIIAPSGSPINNVSFDCTRSMILNDILNDEAALEYFWDEFSKLPRRTRE